MAVTAVKAGAPEPDPLGLDSLTAAETAMAERQAAQSIATLGNEKFPQTTLMGSLGWVLNRRSNPKLTFDSYMSSRTLNDITAELFPNASDEDDPGKDEGSSASAS